MKEHSFRKVNVLGIDVSVMRPEKAVNLTMDYMRRKGLEVVFFHSAESSLYCQNQSWAAESVQNMQLVQGKPLRRLMVSATLVGAGLALVFVAAAFLFIQLLLHAWG